MQAAIALACLLASFLAAIVVHLQAGVVTQIAATATVSRPDNIAIHSLITESGYPTWFGLRPEELAELAATLADDANVAGFTQWLEAIGPGELQWMYYVGVTPEYFGIMGLRLRDGRLPLNPGECVLGAAIASAMPANIYGKHEYPTLSSALTVVGHLQATSGPAAPAPPHCQVWHKTSADVFVFAWRDNPCVRSPIGRPYTPTGLHILLEPKGDRPGLVLDRALEMVKNWYPEAKIDVAVGSTLQITLDQVRGQLESHYSYLTAGFVAVVCFMVANLVLYNVARDWRSISIRRCLGATRFDIWARQAGAPLAAVVAGTAVGMVASAVWGPGLSRALGLPWGESSAFLVPPAVIGLAALSTLGASLRATSVPPRAGLRGPLVSFRARRVDIRKVLAGGTLAIAVASLLVVTVCGRSGMAHIESVLASSGERTVLVSPPLGGDEASAAMFSLLTDRLPSSHGVVRQALVQVPVRTSAAAVEAPVYAVQGSFLEVRGWSLSSKGGRGGKPGARTCYIGAGLAKELFPGVNPIGEEVVIAGRSFIIDGVVQKRPDEMIDLVSDRDRSLVAPLDSVSDLPHFRTRSAAPEIWVALPSSVPMAEGLERVRAELADFPDTEVQSLLTGVHTLEAVRRAGNVFLLGLSVCGLLVAGLAVSACFVALSRERRRDTAIRRIVGARWQDTLPATAREVVSLCLASSVLGVGLGMAAAFVLCRVQGWPERLYWDLALLALAAAAVIVLPVAATSWMAGRGTLREQLRIEE